MIYEINNQISEFTKGAGVKFLYPPRPREFYTYGGNHFNWNGKRIIAAKIGRWLEQVFSTVTPREEKNFL